MAKPVVVGSLPYPEILWSLPQNIYQGNKGVVLIVGGSQGNIRDLLLCAEACFSLAPIPIVMALPESVAASLPGLPSEITTLALPETPSGTLSMRALGPLEEQATRTDILILGPDISRQEETQQFCKQLFRKLDRPMILTGDGLEPLDEMDFPSKKTKVILVADSGRFGRLLKRSDYKKHEPKTIIEYLYQHHLNVLEEVSSAWRIGILLTSPETVAVNENEQAFLYPKINQPDARLELLIAGLTAALARTQPAKIFEAATVALLLLQKASEQELLSERGNLKEFFRQVPNLLTALERAT